MGVDITENKVHAALTVIAEHTYVLGLIPKFHADTGKHGLFVHDAVTVKYIRGRGIHNQFIA